MKILAIQSSPNQDGLTSRLAQAALAGAGAEGAEVDLVHLNALNIRPCQACGNGWGQCGKLYQCVHQDDFEQLRAKIMAADGLVFSTPVYFHDLSESAKIFLDRLRRCEWPQREQSKLRGKPVVGIAAAGGSGNGAVNGARNLEAYLATWLGMKQVAYLAVTRSQEWQLDSARHAGAQLARVIRYGK